MLKPQELRIGNTIKRSQSDSWLDSAKGEFVTVGINELIDLDVYRDNDKYEPIPITPGILEQCVFLHDVIDDTSYYRKGKFWLFHKDEDWYWSGFEDECKSFQYLHQLQNLFFALSGEELQITQLI